MDEAWRLCSLLVALLSTSLATAGPLRSQIVGGHEAKPHSRPYAAALKIRGNFGCGGFLIAPRWVMSAAHCNREISVILGAHDLKAVEKTQQVFGVISSHPHPGYYTMGGVPFNDILLLKLDREVQLNENVQMIPLPKSKDDLPKNTRCSVAGWGRIDATYLPTPKLFETNVTIPGRRRCLQSDPELTDGMLCAGSRATLCDISNGDSGSALICNGAAHGIVSYGFQIPPSIYTRVAYYLPWIQATMNEH
ncbi:mast cell protease 2-like [Erythrolamprus reginae]|uniref:mast cell protease 2-like n=1 Tax=Erythrolamprus reginae TaxID=121349 RepID=UPI00396C40F4